HAAQQPLAVLVQREMTAQRGRVELAVDTRLLPAQPPRLALTGAHDLLARASGIDRGRRGEVVTGGPAEVRDEVDALQQRPAEAAAVAREVAFATAAGAVLAEVPAGA